MLLHSPFDIVKGVAIDSLHVFFLGVVSDLLKYWFDKKYCTAPFSTCSKVYYSCFPNTVIEILFLMHIAQCHKRLKHSNSRYHLKDPKKSNRL